MGGAGSSPLMIPRMSSSPVSVALAVMTGVGSSQETVRERVGSSMAVMRELLS